jgi:hypothetical protein
MAYLTEKLRKLEKKLKKIRTKKHACDSLNSDSDSD